MIRKFLLVSAACGLIVPGLAACASEAPTSEGSPSASVDCSPGNVPTMSEGVLTIGTDKPAYSPYFKKNDPSNGKGFESALAYALAEQLGFTAEQVEWVTVPFNKSYAPGAKDFDFDLNQISITPKRENAVDFSDGYYTVNQSVVALSDSPIVNATTIADLKAAKLGAQVGTTSLDFITDVVQPTQEAFVYNDTNDAKSALEAEQIDGIVVDLPTAYEITATTFDDGVIVGQFEPQGEAEEFGILFATGNPLVVCVNEALATLSASGDLQTMQDQWLAGPGAPYLEQ